MSYWQINYIIGFALSVFLSGILIPKILLIAFRKKLFDLPDDRKVHRGAVPRLGGIAFTPVMCFVVSLLFAFAAITGETRFLDAFSDNALVISLGFCAILVIYITGMADDLVGVRYRAKFIVQITAACLLYIGGLSIDNLCGLFGIHEVAGWVQLPLTVFVVVGIVNAVNLIDGIDGLASGLAGAALIIYGCSFAILGSHVFALISFATLGVLIPFFYYNVFGKAERGKKIFMGDTGSLTIGVILSFLGLRLLDVAQSTATGMPNAVILVVSPLIIPCFDVVRVFIHRVRFGANPFLPDKNHIHHKLLALGMRQHFAMVAIVTIAILFSVVNIYLSTFVNVTALLVGDIVVWTVLNIWISNCIHQRRIRNGEIPGRGPNAPASK